MATFDPKYAHDVLLPLAEAAYSAAAPANLPPNFQVVGPITVDPNHALAMAALAAPAAALPYHLKLIQNMRKDGDVFGWVFQDTQSHTLVVSFRGTVTLSDWLNDFDFLPDNYAPIANYGTVHKGFQAVYLIVQKSVFRQIGTAAQDYTRLIITGHSLGSALSELAAPDLLHNARPKVTPEVQNFAGPRTGHHDFATRFDIEIDVCFRVVNVWDLVPRLPPPLALFEHVGMAVSVDGGFTLDELRAHSMPLSYEPGLAKLIPQAGVPITAPAFALANGQMLIGREL
jgi:triacylglycerol lipase